MHTLNTKDIISYSLMFISLVVCGLAYNWSAVAWILVCGVTYFYLCRCLDELAMLRREVAELDRQSFELHKELHKRNQAGVV